eukprot:6842063-Pyramimonas_sp.AAC.1
MLKENATPSIVELEQAQEALNGISNNRWPMAASVVQWAQSKKLFRDAQTAVVAFSAGVDLAKRAKANVAQAQKHFEMDARAEGGVDSSTRLLSMTGSLRVIDKLFADVTPMAE